MDKLIEYAVIGAIVLIVGAALIYIVRSKRKGKCIGCPDSASCHGNCPHCKSGRK